MTGKPRHFVTALSAVVMSTATIAVAQTDVEQAKREHWSYQPIADPAAPTVKHADRVRDPIDTFVLGRLEAANMEPATEADRRTLIRRVYFDLIGLPPSFGRVERFAADESPDAYEKLVDELLASPAFGERWGRHWLDVARYADTIGYDGGGRERKFPFAWTYRDYVIRSFNEDKPYDRFVTEQIAADRLGLGEGDENLAALGMLTVGRQFLGRENEIIDDRIDVVTRGLMAMTVGCARCHDHKYDPIPTTDYYALYGVFKSVDTPEVDGQPVIGEPTGTPQQREKFRQKLAEAEKAIADHLQGVRDAVGKETRDRFDEYLMRARGEGETIKNERGRLIETFKRVWQAVGSPKELDAAMKDRIIDGVVREVNIVPHEHFNQTERDEFNRKKGKIIELMLRDAAAPPRAMIVTEAKPYDPYVFVRGNQGERGAKVDRRFLTVLGGQTFADGSGRLELAKAITAPDNPLTARVWANRVWLHLFGDGLVRTPGDFGARGEEPTHPLLLDHLATLLIKSGWSTKSLIRTIVLSGTYRQSSADPHGYANRDPDNRMLWRMNRKRLGFEALRDASLAIADRLDRSIYGRPVDLFRQPYTTRRAVYGFIDRQDLPQTLRAFDFASPDASTPQRPQTTVPQQALFMMNSPFIIEQATAAFARVAPANPGDLDARATELYRLVLSRSPSADEVAVARAYLGDSPSNDAWVRYTQALMLSNEFVFLD